jgi:hypothetical protein
MPHCASTYAPANGTTYRFIEPPNATVSDPTSRLYMRLAIRATATRSVAGYTPLPNAFVEYKVVAVADVANAGDETQPHVVDVYPVWYRDIFGCGRISEWRGPCAIWARRGDGNVVSTTGCLHVMMAEQGLYWWVDQTPACVPQQPDSGEFICGIKWAGNASIGTASGTFGTGGVVQHRAALVGGMLPPEGVWEGTWTAAAITGEPAANDVWCPPVTPARVITANQGTTCCTQQVLLPAKYRVRVAGNAKYTLDQIRRRNIDGNIIVDTTLRDHTLTLQGLMELRSGSISGTYVKAFTNVNTINGTTNTQTGTIPTSPSDPVGYICDHPMVARGLLLSVGGGTSGNDYYARLIAGVQQPQTDWSRAPCVGAKKIVLMSPGPPDYRVTLEWKWNTSFQSGVSVRAVASYSETFELVSAPGNDYLERLNTTHQVEINVTLEPLEGDALCPDTQGRGVPVTLPSEADARAAIAAWLGGV